MKRNIQRTDIEASESCVGLSVSILVSQFFFPSVFEKVKVERGLKEKRERDRGFEIKDCVPWSSEQQRLGRAERRTGRCWTAGPTPSLVVEREARGCRCRKGKAHEETLGGVKGQTQPKGTASPNNPRNPRGQMDTGTSSLVC